VGGETKGATVAAGTSAVLLTLAAAQFLMALDASVMNVSIATVAKDLGTTVTGIQTAIVLYTLVMAMLMITGGKIGSIIGRKRAFAIGCVIYACGSFTTAISPNLAVMIFGWSLLEGVGASLIMPAIVALVATNFPPEGRPRAYGLVGAAAAIAIAVGPLIGGLATTYASWRWVFAGEVVLAAGILLFARRFTDATVDSPPHLDLVGSALSAVGLGLAVFGVLRSGEWGWLVPAEGAPSWFGMSPVFWCLLGGGASLWLFMLHVRRLAAAGAEPLVQPSLFANRQMTGGLTMFSFQFMVMMGLFFVIPLYLSVALGLSAIDTGIKITPLSVTMLLAAAGIPRLLPKASPRRVVQSGWVIATLGIVILASALDVNASAGIVTVPLLLIGLAEGALASQLGSVTVSAVPDDLSPEVGGLQNTATQFGASLGTALAGSVLIASLTASFLSGIAQNPAVPEGLSSKASVELSAGVPFVSDAQLTAALDDAGVDQATTQAIVDQNEQARVDGLRSALGLLALASVVALFFVKRIPTRQPGGTGAPVGSGP
jgi:MFS family permease